MSSGARAYLEGAPEAAVEQSFIIRRWHRGVGPFRPPGLTIRLVEVNVQPDLQGFPRDFEL